MGHTAVTFEELLADFEATTAKWKEFFAANPGAASVPTDIAGSKIIAGLVCHIYAAALRTSERILADPFSEPGKMDSLDAAWNLETRAVANLRRFLSTATDATYNEIVNFHSRIAGDIAASRRKLCLHIFIHAIRHWAQIATVLRQHGHRANWVQDILASTAIH